MSFAEITDVAGQAAARVHKTLGLGSIFSGVADGANSLMKGKNAEINDCRKARIENAVEPDPVAKNTVVQACSLNMN